MPKNTIITASIKMLLRTECYLNLKYLAISLHLNDYLTAIGLISINIAQLFGVDICKKQINTKK